MKVSDMWKSLLGTQLVLIFLDLALFTLGMTPWMVLGILLLAGGMFLSWRVGMNLGHQACSIREMVRRAEDPDNPAHGQVDPKVAQKAWSVQTGVRAMLASAIVPYAAGCLYIASTLLNLQPLIMPMRVISWVMALPYWPVVLPWTQTFDRLTPTVAAVLMISPFVLPLCCFAGYMQGPKLWAKSEKAMAEGRRRAKAKSRVNRKKRVPRAQKPEI